MWVHGEPGACVMVTVGSLFLKDFIDDAGWMLLWCWRQMPELAWVNEAVRAGCGALGGLVGAVFGGQRGSGQASSIVGQYVDHLPW